MEQVILTVGVTFTDVLLSLLFGIVCMIPIWYVLHMYKRLGGTLTFVTSLGILLLLLTIVAAAEVDADKASINLSERATPVVSHVNVEKLTSVGNCRYMRDTTVWLIDGVIVRKQVVDGTYTCIPDNNKEFMK